MFTLRHHTDPVPVPIPDVQQDISHGELAYAAMVDIYMLTEDPDRAHYEYINTLKQAI